MFNYAKKTHSIPGRKSNWYQLLFLTTFSLLIVYLISGCTPAESKQLYENSENGISLEKPENWDLAFNKRNGFIVLEAENGILDKASARIEIFAGTCPPNSANADTSQNSPHEILERDIHRIGILYDLNSVTVVQEPIRVETKDYEVTKAVIAIPTMSMLGDSARNQVGDPGPDVLQTIDLFVITDSNNTIMAYIYKGNSNVLNTEAQEIVDSIQRNCLDGP
jgi:hypothetical protein